MKNMNKPKVIAFVVIFGALSTAVLAFQNFTPHVSQQPSDVSDLYMNSALSTALKTKEQDDSDRKVASLREISWEDNSEEKKNNDDMAKSEDLSGTPDLKEH